MLTEFGVRLARHPNQELTSILTTSPAVPRDPDGKAD
jgi:hypothetical protein